MLSLARILTLWHRRKSNLPGACIFRFAVASRLRHTCPSGKNFIRGGASVRTIAIAAVALEIIGHGLGRASSFAGYSCHSVCPIPPKPNPTGELSGDQFGVV